MSRIEAVPDLPPCGCPCSQDGGWAMRVCWCECHSGPPISRALMTRQFVDIWNAGLAEDDPQRKRHLS